MILRPVTLPTSPNFGASDPQIDLKGLTDRAEIVIVTSCPTCSLPAADSRVDCAFCGNALFTTPLLARLTSVAPNQILFASGNRTLGELWQDQNLWRVQLDAGDVFSLVRVTDESGSEILMFDSEMTVVASLRTILQGGCSSMLLTDAEDVAQALLRTDGAGGLHLLDSTGDVLVYAGRSTEGAIDVLITDCGASRPLVVTLALLAVMEAERLGPLHDPATAT